MHSIQHIEESWGDVKEKYASKYQHTVVSLPCGLLMSYNFISSPTSILIGWLFNDYGKIVVTILIEILALYIYRLILYINLIEN